MQAAGRDESPTADGLAVDCPTCSAHIEPRDDVDRAVFAALEGLKCPRCGTMIAMNDGGGATQRGTR